MFIMVHLDFFQLSTYNVSCQVIREIQRKLQFIVMQTKLRQYGFVLKKCILSETPGSVDRLELSIA